MPPVRSIPGTPASDAVRAPSTRRISRTGASPGSFTVARSSRMRRSVSSLEVAHPCGSATMRPLRSTSSRRREARSEKSRFPEFTASSSERTPSAMPRRASRAASSRSAWASAMPRQAPIASRPRSKGARTVSRRPRTAIMRERSDPTFWRASRTRSARRKR